jgi:hypothetical protein
VTEELKLLTEAVDEERGRPIVWLFCATGGMRRS